MDHPLDNAVWNGMISGNKHLCTGSGMAKWFFPEVSPFAAIRTPESGAFGELYAQLPEDGIRLLKLPPETSLPDFFSVRATFDVTQMIGTRARESPIDGKDLRDLNTEDVPAMLAITKKMNPGPFSSRTIEFGGYRGIFREDRLVAMAGTRFQPEGYVEISAVCTYPEFGGKGFGQRLLSDQVNRILSQGKTPFLHVMSDREIPIRLYSKLGFEIRKRFFVYVISKTR